MDRIRRLGQRRGSQDTKNTVGTYGPISPVQNGSSHMQVLAGTSTESVEGFICPTCHGSFVAMNELLTHASTCNGGGADSSSPFPLADSFAKSNGMNGSGSSVDPDEMLLKVNGYDALKEGNELLRQELHSSHKQQQSLSEQIEKMRIESDSMQRKMADQERAMNQLKLSHDDTQFDKLASERTVSKAELNKLQEKIAKLETEKETLGIANASLKKATDDVHPKAQAEMAALKSIVESQQATAAKNEENSRKSFSDAQSEVTRLKVELKDSNGKLQQLKEALEESLGALKANSEEKNREIQTKNAQILTISAEKSGLENIIEEKTTELDNLRKNLNNDRELTGKLEEKLKIRSRELEAKSGELDRLLKEVEAGREQIERHKADLQDVRSKLLSEVDGRLAVLAQLSEAELTKEALSERLKSATCSLDSGGSEISKLKQQLEEMTSQIQSDDASAVLIAQLREDKASLERHLADVEAKFNLQSKTLREEKFLLQTELENGKRALEAMERSLEEEKIGIAEYRGDSEKNVQALRDDLGTATDTAKILSTQLLESVAFSEAAVKECADLKEQVKENATQKASLLAQKKELEARLTVLELSSTDLKLQIQNFTTEKESLLQAKTDLKDQIDGLQSRQESLFADLWAAQQVVEQLQTEKQNLQASLSGSSETVEEQRKLATSLQSKIDEFEKSISIKDAEFDQLRTSLVLVEDSARNLQAALDTVTAERDLTLKEKRVMQELVAAASTDLETARKQQGVTSDSLNKLLLEHETLRAEKKKAQSDLQSLEADLAFVRNGVAEKDTEIASLRQEIYSLDNKKESELQLTSQKLTVLERSHESLQKQISEAHASAEAAQENSTTLQEQLVILLEEKTTRTADFATLQTQKIEADKKADDLAVSLKEHQVRIEEILKRITLADQEIKGHQFEVERLKVELEATKKEVELNALRLDERNGVIHNLLIEAEKAKSEAAKVEEDLKSGLKQLEEEIRKTENALDQAQDEATEAGRQMALLKVTSESNQTQLKEAFASQEKNLLAELEQSKRTETEAIALIKKYEVKVAELEGARETGQRALHQVQTERDSIATRILELEEEKRVSLTRCVQLEEEKDKLQTNIAETRRKYEDSLAAMHELGRENQSLQVECARLKSRKWAVDEHTADCAACGKAFGLTQRKHHCRCCGEIFCNDCSLKTASIVASKKPVRVCDSCFLEIQGRM